jgi:hypothetical protein
VTRDARWKNSPESRSTSCQVRSVSTPRSYASGPQTATRARFCAVGCWTLPLPPRPASSSSGPSTARSWRTGPRRCSSSRSRTSPRSPRAATAATLPPWRSSWRTSATARGPTRELLLGDDADRAAASLVEHLRLVGELHGATAGRAETYARVRRALGSSRPPRPLYKDPWSDARGTALTEKDRLAAPGRHARPGLPLVSRRAEPPAAPRRRLQPERQQPQQGHHLRITGHVLNTPGLATGHLTWAHVADAGVSFLRRLCLIA